MKDEYLHRGHNIIAAVYQRQWDGHDISRPDLVITQ